LTSIKYKNNIKVSKVNAADPMKFPLTAAKAAIVIEKMALKQGLTVAQYCYKKGVSPSVITRWKTRNKSYQISTFLRLIRKR